MLPIDFKLERPLIWLDCETTGVQPKVDRIVEIGLIKLYPDGRMTSWETKIHPEMAIPREVVKVHGIDDEKVKDAPKFRDIAPKIVTGLKDCDIGGFNVGFDIKFIKQELERLKIGLGAFLDNAKIIDAYRIFTQREPRDLTAAIEFYLGGPRDGAHSALPDAMAAMQVFWAQLQRYPDLPRNVGELHTIYFEKIAEGHVDPEGKLAWRHGQVTINFGKHAGTPLRMVERKYLEWMVNAEFSETVKTVIRQALAGQFPTRD